MQDGAASCSAATRKARTWSAVGKPQFPVGGLLAKLALPTTKLVLAASLATKLKGAAHNADVNPLRVLSRPLRPSSSSQMAWPIRPSAPVAAKRHGEMHGISEWWVGVGTRKLAFRGIDEAFGWVQPRHVSHPTRGLVVIRSAPIAGKGTII